MVAPGGHAWLLWEGMCGCSWGACVVAPGGGMRGCSQGGMRGCSGGACMVAPWRHAWLLPGACMVAPGGGMRGCSGGMCMVAPGGACVGYDKIRRYGQ